MPCKTAVFEKCSNGHDRAVRVRSANSVRRNPDGSWYADNFDGVGFIDALIAGGHQISGKRVLQVGVGGAGASLAYCLAEAGSSEIRLRDVDQVRASNLAKLVSKTFPDCTIYLAEPDPTGMDLIANATPMGLQPYDPLSLETGALTAEMTVVETRREARKWRGNVEARAQRMRVSWQLMLPIPHRSNSCPCRSTIYPVRPPSW